MSLNAPPISSGIAALDDAWGGLHRSGSYLLFGKTDEDARLLALDLARVTADRGGACLFVATWEPKSLADFAAARLGFDLAGASRTGTFRLSPMPPALSDGSLSDDARARAWADLAAFACAHEPALFVIDDLTPLTRFEDAERFADAFDMLQARLAEAGIPFVFAASSPRVEVRDRLIEAATGIAGVNLVATADADPRIVALRAVPGEGRPSWTSETERRQSDPEPRGDGSPHRLGTAARSADPEPAPRTGIDYLDLSTSTAFTPHDAFAPSDVVRGLEHGHYVAADATVHTAPKPLLAAPLHLVPLGNRAVPLRADIGHPASSLSVEGDLFEEVDVTATLQTLSPKPAPENRRTSKSPPPAPRIAFVRAFEEALGTWQSAGTPFLAVALRMPPDHPAARRFHFVLQALDRVLGEREVLLAHEARRRAVWLMPGCAPEDARPVFAALKAHLREAAAEADHMMQNAAAAVVPNGRPFPNATEFLAHFFDGA